MLYFSNLDAITHGKQLQLVEDKVVTDLLTDSRKLLVSPGAVFFAIQGTRHNGHQFIPDLYQKGVRQFVVQDQQLSILAFPGANFLLVANCIDALQAIASYHRQMFSVPVVGITGSNGKTIVKEWLSELLAEYFNLVKSPKSYNSQLGVPLSVWQLQARHELAIFEAGISMPGEMEKLVQVIRPTIGIFTNIGTAHDANFKDEQEKIIEKAVLFHEADLVIYRRDHAKIHEILVQNRPDNQELLDWGNDSEAQLKIIRCDRGPMSAELNLLYRSAELSLTIPFNDEASIENCMHCIAFMLHEKIALSKIQIAVNRLKKVAMRLELKQGINQCYLVDDTYNNDFAGLQIALNFLDQQKQRNDKLVILSDLLQTGMDESELYKKVASVIFGKGVRKLVGIGPGFMRHNALFDDRTTFFETTKNFLNVFQPADYNNELILIKGARVFEFEQIVKQLQQKIHGTVLEISLDALTHNLNYYKSKLRAGVKLMVMVKAYAYGSGSFEVANLLQFNKVDYLAVAYADEGIALRENGIHLPIMVMNPSMDSFNKLLRYQLEPEIFSLNQLGYLIAHMTEIRKEIKIHLKLDTGMHRLGLAAEEIEEAMGNIIPCPFVKIATVFTHLSGADEEAHNEFSKQQMHLFEAMAGQIERVLQRPVIKHVLNSAGIVRFSAHQYDMVRLGIGLYGVEVNQIAQQDLLPISVLKTNISQIKKIKKGETIGYSRKGIATKDLVTATIAIGYADGYSRGFSNGKGQVVINGALVPVIGNVCMDMTMVDITGIPAREGDEVIIFGPGQSIKKLADSLGTIPYEILTNISERVKRIFYSE